MNTNLKTTNSKLASPWMYFVATFIWTWIFWSIPVFTGATVETVGGGIPLLLGVIGPMVTGITFTYLTRDQADRRDYWKRIIDFKRPGKWYLVIFLFVPVLNVLAARNPNCASYEKSIEVRKRLREAGVVGS